MLVGLVASLVLGSNRIAVAPVLVDGMLAHPTHVLVKYRDEKALEGVAKRFNVLRKLPEIRWAVIDVPAQRLQKSKAAIQQLDGVENATFDRAARLAYEPNDPLYQPDGWGLRAIKANLAWDITKGDPSVIVAVIDTGVRLDHEDLANNLWVNTGEIPGNGIDDDGNGYVDDVNGYDFANGDSDPSDDYGHGTACAGLVAAVQDNNKGCSGVAPHTRVMALKAALSNGYFYDSANTPAYIYAANNGAKVLSMSFFSDRVSPMEEDGINYCWSHGVLPVCAAGNSASVIPYYPGAYENTLSVAAVNENLNKAGFSNYGSWVDVSAPGVNLATSTMDGDYTTGFSGTSGACPMVAGAAALCFAASPNATARSVRYALEDTATLQNQAPYGEFSNYGLIDAQAAVQVMQGAQSPKKDSVVRWVSTILGPNVNFRRGIDTVIKGRMIGSGNNISVYSNGLPVRVLTINRDEIRVVMGRNSPTLEVKKGNVSLCSISFPLTAPRAFPMSEASTQSATLTGGFSEALLADGSSMQVTRRDDGIILAQTTFHNLQKDNEKFLTIRRRYSGTTSGTEDIYLYDWSSASYPYGNWVSVSSRGVPTSMTTSDILVSNFGRFVDDTGTCYVLVQTSDNIASGGKLLIDQMFLHDRP